MYRKVQKSEVCSSLKFHKMNIPVEPVCKLRNGIFPEPQRCFFESRPLLQAYIPSIRFFWTVRNWKHTLCTLLCLDSVAQHYVCELYLYCWQVVFIMWTCPVWSSSCRSLSRHVDRHVWWAGGRLTQAGGSAPSVSHPPGTSGLTWACSPGICREMIAHPSFHSCHIY